jgi:hypothetical protein
MASVTECMFINMMTQAHTTWCNGCDWRRDTWSPTFIRTELQGESTERAATWLLSDIGTEVKQIRHFCVQFRSHFFPRISPHDASFSQPLFRYWTSSRKQMTCQNTFLFYWKEHTTLMRMTRLWFGWPGFDSRQCTNFLHHNVRTGFGTHLATYTKVEMCISLT